MSEGDKQNSDDDAVLVVKNEEKNIAIIKVQKNNDNGLTNIISLNTKDAFIFSKEESDGVKKSVTPRLKSGA